MDLKDQLFKLLNESVQDTFNAILNLIPVMTNEQFMPAKEAATLSSIGFAGKLAGTFSLCLENSFACDIVSKMLDMEIKEINSDVTDGIGEIVNIIIGGVKMKLATQNAPHDFNLGIPTAVRGNQLEVFGETNDLVKIMQNYTCGNIKFCIVLMYKINEEKEEEKSVLLKNKKLDALAKLNKLMGEKK